MVESDAPGPGPTRWHLDAADPDPDALAQVAETLRGGGVVAVPTDTYYGLAADPRIGQALERVCSIKGRDDGAPLLLLADELDRARALIGSVPGQLDALARAFWPGPLTVVVPAAPGLSRRLVGPSGGVALRVPDAAIARLLGRSLGAPITGTSANRSGAQPVTRADAIRLGTGALDGIVDGGATPGGAPSTLLDLTGPRPRMLREGAVEAARIEAVLGGRLL